MVSSSTGKLEFQNRRYRAASAAASPALGPRGGEVKLSFAFRRQKFQVLSEVAAQPERRAGIAHMRADRLAGAQDADDNFRVGTVFALRRAEACHR